MSKTYRIVIDVTADESDRLLDTETVRLAIGNELAEYFTDAASDLGGWDEVSALITRIRVDGREYDIARRTLEVTPINAEIAEDIMLGRKIQAIKALRANNEGMTLIEAKDLVDKWAANR